MAEPLDYRNPGTPADAPRPKPAVRAAIPVDFDTLVTRTPEPAAVRAIEAELTRARIEFHVAHHGEQTDLFVRAGDYPRASLIAVEVFVRRRKLKSSP